jgi:hypothetical protein
VRHQGTVTQSAPCFRMVMRAATHCYLGAVKGSAERCSAIRSRKPHEGCSPQGHARQPARFVLTPLQGHQEAPGKAARVPQQQILVGGPTPSPGRSRQRRDAVAIAHPAARP